MAQATDTEKYFEWLDKGTTRLQKELDLVYLEALALMGESVFQKEVPAEIKEKELIKNLINKIEKLEAPKEAVRRAIQLAVLKGMREATQPHHAMTPDAVALFIGFLLDKLLSKTMDENKYVLYDPALGAGNLMTAVSNQMKSDTHFIGVEPDETLLQLAFVNANLQKHSVDLFHQDSVASQAIKNVHAVVSDLPIGYYPNDDIASKFSVAASSGHTYVHHLLIEQAIDHTVEGGFLVFLVPNSLFQSEQSDKLHAMVKQTSDIYAFLQLPATMFKTKQAAKSILVLRKKKDGVIPPKQALLAELPSFAREDALKDMMAQISTWFDQNL
ncbi:class I SAM-dependent methyltransferase [Paenalkalicoccus suaedae]|uniref:Class I SAM-dependent methyltransferase n=1 Tax=Paenalkalicoccus suaedae TaxID=2592382 RepID=A0A859FIJ3_9BACI|nr:class I SAM-dependent methyltransferase [Paenalkalicoccus suaedae]QKS72056.1 class I SAM-dependent methyltransferase [Paenalkalicoccus suaedae]